MKDLNVPKDEHSAQTPHNKDKENDLGIFQISLGAASEGDVETKEDLEDVETLAIRKDDFRLNTTGTDDDLAIDIQDALGRDTSLSLVTDNILVTVEGEIATLEGEVYSESEKMTAGDIATACVGYDKVNNYLGVIHNKK